MGKCVRVTQKKYATRPLPPFHAGDCLGQTIEGNDGRQYKSIKTKTGSHVWIPVSSSKTRKTTEKPTDRHRYEIHDNGGVPFIVEDYPKKKRVIIYENDPFPDTGQARFGKKLHEIKYKTIWLGENVESNLFGDFEKGNTIVLQTAANKYVAICRESIISFSLDAGEAVSKFIAPIGSNDVPYPYLVGTKNVYLLLERVQLPIELIDMNDEPYSQYYGHGEFSGKGLKKKAVAMKYKFL